MTLVDVEALFERARQTRDAETLTDEELKELYLCYRIAAAAAVFLKDSPSAGYARRMAEEHRGYMESRGIKMPRSWDERA